jgi:hypothetical protein
MAGLQVFAARARDVRVRWPAHRRSRSLSVECRSIKIDWVHTLIDVGRYRSTAAALRETRSAIEAIRWPARGKDFAIFPESGKARGEGNGVVPIREAFVVALRAQGWTIEMPFPLEGIKDGARFGAMDAAKRFGSDPPFMVEWETGNISSSHRSMNKLALGLIEGAVSGGVLIVPTQALAQYLTDRIGNVRELEPYFPLWSSISVTRGYLGVIAVEHDRTSRKVHRIVKGTSGRALL